MAVVNCPSKVKKCSATNGKLDGSSRCPSASTLHVVSSLIVRLFLVLVHIEVLHPVGVLGACDYADEIPQLLFSEPLFKQILQISLGQLGAIDNHLDRLPIRCTHLYLVCHVVGLA